jgi:signal transduction histidine kinase
MPRGGIARDNEIVSESKRVLVRALAFARSAEPRASLSRCAVLADTVVAAVVLAVSLFLAKLSRWPGHLVVNPRTGVLTIMPGQVLSVGDLVKHELVAIVLLSVPLAARRRFPLTGFGVLLLGAIVTRQYATDITFLAIIFAGYSAVAYSRFRNAALLSAPLAGVIVAAAFWAAAPATSAGSAIPGQALAVPQPPGFAVAYPWRLPGLLVAASLILVAVVANAMQARDRIRRLRSEHLAATRRALALERARLASEMHDVVTHNVSMMVVQAGAARRVLRADPAEATKALRAVESSGRTAMTELRHLLGLLSPPLETADAGEPAGQPAAPLYAGSPDGAVDLAPQPGLGELREMVGRVVSAGLPVELRITGTPRNLPPGLGLAVFRVVQEALTNVIKHAGRPRTEVGLSYEPAALVVEVADDGRPIPAAGPAPAASGAGVPRGAGVGLLGLRERVALYGGELAAGPRPGGGWLVRARIPVEPAEIPAEAAPP